LRKTRTSATTSSSRTGTPSNLWYLNKDLKKVVRKEKDKVTVDKEVMEEVSTSIIREALLDSIEISRKLQLPPPMNLPRVEVKSKGESKTKAA